MMPGNAVPTDPAQYRECPVNVDTVSVTGLSWILDCPKEAIEGHCDQRRQHHIRPRTV